MMISDKDYHEAKKALINISRSGILNISGVVVSSVLFAISKFFREKIRTTSEFSRFVEFCSKAILANTKLGNYYAIERILETLLARLSGEEEKDIIHYIRNVYDGLEDRLDTRIGLLVAEKLLEWDISEAMSILRKTLQRSIKLSLGTLSVLRRIVKKLGEKDVQILFQFLEFLKRINETLFYSMLGAATKSIDLGEEENIDRIISEVLMTTLHNKIMFICEAPPSTKIFKIVFSDILDNILSTSETISEDALYRALSLFKFIDMSNTIKHKIEHIIRSLHNQKKYSLSRLIAINYSLAIIEDDPVKSKIFNDLAINISYQIGDSISVARIYGEYIAHLIKRGKLELALRVLREAYDENKIRGYLNMDLWLPITQKIQSIETLERIEEVTKRIEDHLDDKERSMVECILTLTKIRITNNKQLLEPLVNKILDMGDVYFIIKTISYLKQKGHDNTIVEIVDKVLNIDFDIKELSEILYAAMFSLIELGKVDRVRTILSKIRKTRIKNAKEIYAGLILETAIKILDLDKEFSCNLLYEAYRIFESVGMRWMSLNALALLAAHRGLDDTYI